MKNFVYHSAVAALLLVMSLPTHAGEGEANITLVSDYIFRGVSLTNNSAVLQAGYEYDFGNDISVGAWYSSLPGINTEYDLYARYGSDIGNFGYSAGVILYSYSSAPHSLEFNLALSYNNYVFMSSFGDGPSYNELNYETRVSDIGLKLHLGSDGTDPDMSMQLMTDLEGFDIALVFAAKQDSGTSIVTPVYALTIGRSF